MFNTAISALYNQEKEMHDWYQANGVKCRACDKESVVYYVYTHGPYEDLHYRCTSCGTEWRICAEID